MASKHHLCVLPKLPLENAKRPRPADIVRHEFVNARPDILPWYHCCVVAVLRQYLLCHCHCLFHLHNVFEEAKILPVAQTANQPHQLNCIA